MSDAAVLRSDPAPGICRLTLNRPQQRNALSVELMTALEAALDACAAEPGLRAIIIAANGPAFCAGHDLKEMTAHRADADKGAAFFKALFTQCSRLMTKIVRHPRPVIAEVHALATAAGCQLVASCDLAVAAEGASFATPGVNIGLFCSTPMVALSRNVPRKQAMEMLLTGTPVTASRALEIGLVNRVTQPHGLHAECEALAALIAAKPQATLKLGKAAFYAQVEMTLDAAYAFASETMTMNMLNAEAEEGIGAFVGKRPPDWPKGE
jgi:enoyl-CoA hydratase/carnithine racemase